jgi:hypothetical protein
MATKQDSKPAKTTKNRAKRIPSVKKLGPVRPLLQACGPSGETH